MIKPAQVGPATSLQDIWNLPGQPRIIANFPACTQPTTNAALIRFPNADYVWPEDAFGSFYANQCSATSYLEGQNGQIITRDEAIARLGPALAGRLNGTDREYEPTGYGAAALTVYNLQVQETIIPAVCLVRTYDLDFGFDNQKNVLDAVKSWYDTNANNARANLNILSGDFLEALPLVADAIGMNVGGPTITTDEAALSDGSGLRIAFQCAGSEVGTPGQASYHAYPPASLQVRPRPALATRKNVSIVTKPTSAPSSRRRAIR